VKGRGETKAQNASPDLTQSFPFFVALQKRIKGTNTIAWGKSNSKIINAWRDENALNPFLGSISTRWEKTKKKMGEQTLIWGIVMPKCYLSQGGGRNDGFRLSIGGRLDDGNGFGQPCWGASPQDSRLMPLNSSGKDGAGCCWARNACSLSFRRGKIKGIRREKGKI